MKASRGATGAIGSAKVRCTVGRCDQARSTDLDSAAAGGSAAADPPAGAITSEVDDTRSVDGDEGALARRLTASRTEDHHDIPIT